MIFDQQNIFFDNSITNGNVIANAGGGDSHNPLFLAVVANTVLDKATTATLQTSDDEAFGTSTTLATFTLPASKKGMILAAKLPYGMKKFARLVLSGATTGAITAGLTETVPNWHI